MGIDFDQNLAAALSTQLTNGLLNHVERGASGWENWWLAWPKRFLSRRLEVFTMSWWVDGEGEDGAAAGGAAPRGDYAMDSRT